MKVVSLEYKGCHFRYLAGTAIVQKEDRPVLTALPAHKATLRHLADAVGETTAVAVRRIIRTTARQLGVSPLEEPTGDREVQ
jgi:hypothetical protein